MRKHELHLPSARVHLTDPGSAPPRGWRRRLQPDGILLFHRASGLNVLLDELRVPPEAISRFPRTVQLALLDACNLRCSFCYASKQGHAWDRGRLLELCRGLDSWGVLELALAGGEPFLYPDLEGLLLELHAGTGLAVHLTTNGLAVPEGFGSRMRGRMGQVRVSVDGLGGVFERLRGAPFHRVLEGIERLRGLPLGLNCLVTRETLPILEDYFSFVRGLGIADVLLLRPFGPGSGLLEGEWRPALRKAILAGREAGLRVSTSCGFGDLGVPTLFPPLPCGSGRDLIFVSSDGRVGASSTGSEGHSFHGIGELRQIYEDHLFPADPARPLCRAGCPDLEAR